MNKHRIFSLFLAIVLVFSCLGTQMVTANETEMPTFTVSSATGEAGEEVTLTIDISNNPGICTATIWVHYDEGLTLKSVTDSRLLVGGLFGGDKSANPYGLYWDDSANFDGDNSSNGTLATLVFSIDSSASPGDYDVWVTYNYGDIYNLDLEDFDFNTVAGKVIVKGDECEHKNTEVRDAVAVSCKGNGYTGDTWCTDCETKIADGEIIPMSECIKYQTRDDKDVRLISYVDALELYSSVSFTITIDGKTSKTLECTTAYEGLYAGGDLYDTEALYGTDGYFVTYTITNYLDYYAGKEVTINMQYKSIDGESYSISRTATIGTE